MANKKRGESNSDRVERYFKDHPNTVHRLGNISSTTGLRMDQVRGAISYLNAKHKAGNAIGIECVERGLHWRYVAPVEKPQVRKLTPAEKAKREGDRRITERERQAKATQREFEGMGPAQTARLLDAQGHEDKPVGRNDFARLTAELADMAPPGEPLTKFVVQGTLKETGELLLKGASPGVEGVWLARRLY